MGLISNLSYFWKYLTGSHGYGIEVPTIKSYKYGEIVLNYPNKEYCKFKDAVILPHTFFNWDWQWRGLEVPKNERMNHSDGYDIKEIEHFLYTDNP